MAALRAPTIATCLTLRVDPAAPCASAPALDELHGTRIARCAASAVGDDVAVAELRQKALRQGVRLETITVIWMTVEAVLALGAGIAAHSVLLTAFGADSLIELMSGGTLLWRLRAESRGLSAAGADSAEARAVRISAVLLLLLCVYVSVTSVAGLVFRVQPESSPLGIAVAAVAVVAMPLLVYGKRIVNKVVGSPALRADIAESVTCWYMAGVTLIGLAAASMTGWWWLQYVAALALLVWLIPEARESAESAMSGREAHEE